MILPRPRVHCTGLDDIHFKLRDDGALQTPPKPRNPTGICDSIEFRFSQDPKNKIRLSRICLWGFGVWGGMKCSAKLEVDVVETCAVDPGPRQYHAAPRRVLEP